MFRGGRGRGDSRGRGGGRGGGGFGDRGGRGGGAGFKRPRDGDSFSSSSSFSRGRGSGGFRGGRGDASRGRGFRPNYAGLGDDARSGARGANSEGFRPQVADNSVPVHQPFRSGARDHNHAPPGAMTRPPFGASRGRGAGFGPSATVRPSSSSSAAPASAAPEAPRSVHMLRTHKGQRDVVVILEKAGLLAGYRGLVDAYERSATTEIANESLKDVRPDIVHQCLLALFDSDLAFERRLRVYINLFARTGKVIEVSPALRPPRTYARFRGLMTALLREGRVTSADGAVLMRLLPGSIAPVIPNGAEVIGLTNTLSAPIETSLALAKKAVAHPVDNALQGGVKNVSAFYCIACTDEGDLDGIDYVTRTACLSAYPVTAHVMCARLCEGHSHTLEKVEGIAQ